MPRPYIPPASSGGGSSSIMENITDWAAFFLANPTFNINDRVVYNGQIYRNTTGTITATTPDLDTTNWIVSGVQGENPENYVYVKGDETTNGSIRFSVDAPTQDTLIEKLILGVWQPSTLVTGPNSVKVGLRVSLSAAGHHFISEDQDGHFHFHAHTLFDGETSTADARVLDAFLFTAREIQQADNTGTITNTSIAFNLPATNHNLFKRIYWQTDTTAASDDVRIETWEGTNETGTKIFDQTYSSTLFPASTEIILDADGFLEVEASTTYHIKVSSGSSFSLKADTTNTTPWVALDTIRVREDDMLQTTEWISGESFVLDQLTIQGRKIYKCTVAGVQTGTFASNSDKWYDITLDVKADRVQTTGLLEGGVISIASGTTVDWTSGHGQVANHADPEAPIITDVTWAAVSGTTPTNLATDGTTIFGYDSSGSLVQKLSTAVAITDAHTTIWFGSATHISSTIVSVVTAPGNLAYDGIGSFSDFINLIIGPANIDGNVYGANGANMTIDVVGGNAFMIGSNFRTDKTIPDTVTLGNDTALTFNKVYRSAGAGLSIEYDGAATTLIDPTSYDDGSGTLATVTAGYWTIQRIFRSRSENTMVAYGQEEFATKALALEALGNESFTEKSPLPFMLFRCSLVVSQSATALNNTAQAEFFEQSSFRVGGAFSASATIPGVTSPGGADKSIQFNNSSTFGGDSNLLYDTTTKTVSLEATSTGTATIELLNSSSVAKAQLEYDDSTDQLNINTPGSDVVFKTTETVFNEASADIDFRVESNASTHALFVNSLNGVIGINNTSPINTLHVYDNNANEYGAVGLQLEQDGTGDSILQHHLTGGVYVTQGLDNDDSDKWKLSRGIDLNTDTVIEIDTSTGDVTFAEDVTASDFLVGGASVVVGPSSSTANYIAVFDDATGKVIAQRSNAYLEAAGSNVYQTLGASGVGGAANFFFRDSVGGIGGALGYNSTSGAFTLDGLDGILALQGYGDIQMQIAQHGLLDVILTSTDDNEPAIRIDNSPVTYGAVFDWYFTDRTPVGNISAAPGSLCFRNNTTSSDIYMHRGTTTNNTDWVDIFATGSGDVDGPSFSTDLAICTFDGTTGKLIQDNSTTTLFTGASEAILKMDASGLNGDAFLRMGNYTGTSLLQFHLDSASDAVSIQALSNADSFDISNLATNVDTNISVTGNASIDLRSTGANTNPPVVIAATGANGATIQLFTSAVAPEGVITGNPGDICIFKSGVNSSFYQLESASAGNTGWVAQSSGDVSGPSSSTSYAIATYSDTSGKVLEDNPRAVIHDDLSITELILTSGDSAGDSRVILRNYLGTELFRMNADDDSDTVELKASSNASSFAIENAAVGVDMELIVTGNAAVDIVSPGANTNAPLRVASVGTNGAVIQFFTSTVNPEGVITGNPGDICYFKSGTSSRILQLEAASAGNTGWVSQEGGDVSGASTTVVNTIPTWGDATGNSLLANDTAFLTTSGSSTALILESPSASGLASLSLKDSSDALQLTVEYAESSDRSQILDYSGSGLDFGSDVGLMSCRSTSATDMFFDIETPDPFSGGSGLRIKASGGSNKVELLYDEAADESLLRDQSTIGLEIATNARILIESTTDHDAELMTWGTTGTSGSAFDIHVGDQNPNTAVTGSGGDMYHSISGATSSIYYHKGATPSTTWSKLLSTDEGSVTADTLAYFSDTTGANIASVPWVRLYSGGNHTSFDVTPIAAPGTSQIGCWDFAESNGVFLNWIDATDTGEFDINDTGIHLKSGPNDSFVNVASKSAAGTAVVKLVDSSDADKFTLQYTESTDSLQIDATEDLDFNMSAGAGVNITTAGANTKAPLALESTGTDGASNSIFLSDVTPIGAIPGQAGDMCFRSDDGIDSNMYLHAGSAINSTAWYTLGFPQVKTSTATESIAVNEDYIRIDATAATRVLTLPDASTVPIGKDYKFKLVAKGAGFYGEITPYSGDSIDGSTSTRRLATVGDVFTLRRTGTTSWDIVQSARDAHAEMYMSGSSFQQTNISSAEAVEAWTDNGSDCQGIITSDQANNKFVINHIEDTTNGDHFKITANLSYEFNSSSIMVLTVYVGGVATNLTTYSKGLGFSNDQLSSVLIGDFTTTSTGDVEVMVESLTGTDTAEWWAGHVDLVRH